jgi:hypothetical protein
MQMVLRKITVDNTKQFDSYLFKEFCYQIGTDVAFTSVYHLQSTGAVEQANTLIFTSIKKCLEDQKKEKWADELSKAVWSHNTSVSRATKFTPFKFLFGKEAVTPKEIRFKSARTMVETMHSPTKVESKDLLESDRLKAVKNLHAYQAKTTAWRDKKVKEKAFDVGDLVLLLSPRTKSVGKLEQKWDRPYLIVEKSRSRSYRISDPEGNMLSHSWNFDYFHHFYIY